MTQVMWCCATPAKVSRRSFADILGSMCRELHVETEGKDEERDKQGFEVSGARIAAGNCWQAVSWVLWVRILEDILAFFGLASV